MEEFTLDPNPLKTTTSKPIPALFTPAYARSHNIVSAARIAVFALNLVVILVPIFSSIDQFELQLLPITIFTSFINFMPTLLAVIFHVGYNSDLKSKEEARDQAGSKRTAILVEDPNTGEERWMLEPKKTSSSGQIRRAGFAVLDVVCVALLTFDITLTAVFGGKKSPVAVGLALADRIIMLVLVIGAGITTFKLMKIKETEEEGSERNDYE